LTVLLLLLLLVVVVYCQTMVHCQKYIAPVHTPQSEEAQHYY